MEQNKHMDKDQDEQIVKNTMILKNPFAENEQSYIDANLSADVDVYQRLDECMRCIEGQEYACQCVKDHLYGHARRKNAKGVAGLLVFMGAPAVGKTYMAEAIAKALGYPYLRLDMTGYSDSESGMFDFAGIHKSYKEAGPGVVTDFVYHHPVCVLVMDELEKAGAKMLQLLLQILERGEIEDKYYQTMVSFKDVIIIMTLNSGREIYDSRIGKYILSDTHPSTMLKALRKEVRPFGKYQDTPVFSEALLSRMSGGCMIMFNKLRPEIIHKILCNTLQKEINDYHATYGFDVDIDTAAMADLLIMNQGEAADIRTLIKAAKSLLKAHVTRVSASMGESSHSYFGRLRYTVDWDHVSPDVEKILHPDVTSRILVYCREEERPLFTSRAGQGVEFLFADPADEPTSLSSLDLTAAIIDVGRENDTYGKELFGRLRDQGQIALYVFSMQAVGYTAFYRYTDQGASECYSPKIRDMDPGAWINRIIKDIRLTYMTAKLFRAGKVISYDIAYKLCADEAYAEILLTDLRLQSAMDAADEESFVAQHQIPDVSFDMIIGAEDAKAELRSCVRYLQNAERYIRQGRRIPRGILLSGAPGTGKTMLAKALAAEAKLPFIEINATEFLKRYIGEGSEKIRELFRIARRYAPAIIFIDEIDVIAKSRMTEDANQALTGDLVNTFLSMMDGFSTQNEAPVFLVAATNFSFQKGETQLDEAFLRRFDTKIEVALPDVAHRELFLRKTLASLPARQVSDETVSSIAKRSIGWNLADLKLVIEKGLRCYEDQTQEMGLSDEVLIETFESFFDGKRTACNEKELLQIACHEAGHALVSWVLTGRAPTYTTIVSRGRYGGYMLGTPGVRRSRNKDDLLDQMCISFGGRVAEALCYGERGINTGASQDLKTAAEVARSIVCDYGMLDLGDILYTLKPMGDDPTVTEKIRGLIHQQYARAEEILTRERVRLDALTEALLQKNSLNEADFENVMEKISSREGKGGE